MCNYFLFAYCIKNYSMIPKLLSIRLNKKDFYGIFTRKNVREQFLVYYLLLFLLLLPPISLGLTPIKALGLSPLVIGIVMGIFYANTLHNQTPTEWQSGITFSAKKILRFAIVLYGFRITFQQIAEVGMDGFLVSFIMLTSTPYTWFMVRV